MHWRRKWQPTPVSLRIQGTGEPGGLPFMGWHRFGHDCNDLAAAAVAATTAAALFREALVADLPSSDVKNLWHSSDSAS